MQLFWPVKFFALLANVKKEYAFMLSTDTILWLTNKTYSLYHA